MLETLESRRMKLYQHLQTVGDFRPGTISVSYRRCGKANCACVRPDHPGHGPQYLWHATTRPIRRSYYGLGTINPGSVPADSFSSRHKRGRV